jgi:hypothetical protein
MKSKFQKFVQSKIFRWLLSAVVLCYVLAPQIGVCHCLDCRCNKDGNLHDGTVTADKLNNSGCCSKESGVSTVAYQGCCSRGVSDIFSSDVQHESPVCPCSLKPVSKQQIFVLPSSIISSEQNYDKLLTDGYQQYSFWVLSTPVVKIVSFYPIYYEPPVRLHLLLLVLLN